MTLGTFIGFNILFIFAFSAIYLITKELIRVNIQEREWVVWLTSFGLGALMILIDQIMEFHEENSQAIFRLMLVQVVFLSTLLELKFFVGIFPFVIGSAFIGKEISVSIFNEMLPILFLLTTSIALSQFNLIKRNGWSTIIKISVVILGQILFQFWDFKKIADGPTIPELSITAAPMIFSLIGYYSITSILQWIPIYFIEKIYRNYFSLEESETLDKLGFVKRAVSRELFQLHVDKNRITNGLLISLKTTEPIKEISEEIRNEYKTSLLFKPATEIFSFFISLNQEQIRDIKIFIKKIEKIFDKNLLNYQAGGTIYGANTVNYAEVVEQSLDSLKTGDERIDMYDFKTLKKTLSIKEEIALNTSYSRQTKITYLNSITTQKNTLIPVFKNENYDDFELRILQLDSRTRSIILSQLALRILKEEQEFKVVIPYSINGLKDVEKFIKKIEKYKKTKEIIISVYQEDIKENNINLKKVNLLRKAGIEISINNYKKIIDSQLKLFKPEYIQSVKKRDIRNFSTQAEELLPKVKEISINTIELG